MYARESVTDGDTGDRTMKTASLGLLEVPVVRVNAVKQITRHHIKQMAGLVPLVCT